MLGCTKLGTHVHSSKHFQSHYSFLSGKYGFSALPLFLQSVILYIDVHVELVDFLSTYVSTTQWFCAIVATCVLASITSS